MPSLQSQLAAFIAHPPADVVAPATVTAATPAIIDAFAAILAGSTSELREAMLQYTDSFAAEGATPVLGTDRRLAADRAALVNATFGHAMDYDDTVSMMPGHPGTIMVSALISAMPDRPVSGQEFLRAFVIGYEVATKFGAAIGMGHYHRGWHTTGTIGVFGAFAAVANLRGLGVREIERGLGIVASMASGLRANFGTMTKPLHSGWAASTGVIAAQLAESGFTGHVAALDGPDGFFAAYGTERSHPSALGSSLGNPFTLVSPGIALKKYACCYALHRPIAALTALRAKVSFEPQDVESIDARVAVGTLKPTPYMWPTTGFEGRFSVTYALAIGGLDGDWGMRAFTDEAVQRPAILDLLERVTVVEDAAMAPEDPHGQARSAGTRGKVEVTLRLRDGRRYIHEEEIPPGSPLRPLTWDDVFKKYRECARLAGIESEQIDSSLRTWADVLDVADIRPAVDALVINDSVLI